MFCMLLFLSFENKTVDSFQEDLQYIEIVEPFSVVCVTDVGMT